MAGMHTDRVEAFSDGVMAIIITIMAFSVTPPASATWHALAERLPQLLAYALSFSFVGIYWNNHHHLLRSTHRISSGVMWANLHLLFWLSLIPIVTAWVADFYADPIPVVCYGLVDLGAAIAYTLLVRAIIKANGTDSKVAQAIGSDIKGRISLAMYVGAVAFAFVATWISYALFVGVAAMWFIPDRRLAEVEAAEEEHEG